MTEQQDQPALPTQLTVDRPRPSPARAWCVHLLTASGAVWGLLAIDATRRSNWQEAFAWLLLAVVVDAVDGPLARWWRVKEALPGFDGALLDNLIDYLNYVIVPAILLDRTGVLPAAYSVWAASGIALASAYQFCQASAKTDDGYFTGFPSYWNIAVFYLLVLDLSPATNLGIIILLIVLVFVPLKYLYPNRTPRFRKLTLSLTIAWGVSIALLMWQLPEPSIWLLRASLLYVIYYVAMSLFQTCILRSAMVAAGEAPAAVRE